VDLAEIIGTLEAVSVVGACLPVEEPGARLDTFEGGTVEVLCKTRLYRIDIHFNLVMNFSVLDDFKT
jgi:hypothetical protein